MITRRLLVKRTGIIRGFHSSCYFLNDVTGTPVELDIVNKLKQSGAQTAKALPKDYSLLKLGAWIVIFGSMLTNVIDKKQQYEEMEEKYKLKIQILNSVIARLKNGEDVDVKDELRLVNQTFERRKIPRYQSPLKLAKNKKSNDMTDIVPVQEESLEDIWKDILKDALETIPTTKSTVSSLNVSDVKSDDIVRDKNSLLATSKQEQDELRYFTPTNQHVIVTKPGEVTEVAKDTKMTKYL
ncbi:inner membrane assembly complex subunit 22 [Monosporozyma unispora]|nr:hypothetical protein C6P44_004114 [Kazachstania unispora]